MCSVELLNSGCQCLTDPFDVSLTTCAYISKLDGLMYPCDSGCCLEQCTSTTPLPPRVELRPSAGVNLPDGFGNSLPISTEPSAIPGAAEISIPPPVVQTSKELYTSPLFWALVLLMLIMFLGVIMA